MEHVIEKPDPNVNLHERILSRDNMRAAWKRIKANKGVAGVDKMSITEFPQFAQKHWAEIRQTLLEGTYQVLWGLGEKNPRLPDYPSSFIDSALQIFLANLLGISVCRGIAST